MKDIKWKIAGVIFIVFIPFLLHGQGVSHLSKKSRGWLEKDAALIISPAERTVFLQLEGETSRDRFINEFWRQRDPDLETRENERQRRLEDRSWTHFHSAWKANPGGKTSSGRISPF